MANSAAAPSYFTQEPQFEEAIKHPISAFWQQRNEGYVTSSSKKNSTGRALLLHSIAKRLLSRMGA